MESRAFIAEANVLVSDIKGFQASFLSPEDELAQGTALQKRINNAFSGLQNPSLLAAMALKEAALGAGFTVAPAKQSLIDDIHRRVAFDARS